MVALLVSHIELHTPAKVADVLAFYADALGAKAYVGGEVSMTAAETASRTLALAG